MQSEEPNPSLKRSANGRPPQNTTRAFLGNTPTRSFFRIAAFLLVQSISGISEVLVQ